MRSTQFVTSVGKPIPSYISWAFRIKPVTESAEAGMLQRSVKQPSTFNSPLSQVPPIVHEVLRSPGEPLDTETREFFEPRFGHDFGQVRVHTDGKAAESARAVAALAYTTGRDIVFGSGQYAPHRAAGKRLLTHELAHVVQ